MIEEKKDDGVEMTGKVKNSQPVKKPTPIKEPTEEKPTVEKSETIEVPKSEFETMKQDIQILREASREDKVMQAEKRIKGEVVELPVGFLKRLKGKLVVKWFGLNEEGSKAKQEVIHQNNIPVGERMVGHYQTIDGEDIVCDSTEFTKSNDIEKFDKVGGYDEDWVIRFHNPELAKKYPDYKINIKYINP